MHGHAQPGLRAEGDAGGAPVRWPRGGGSPGLMPRLLVADDQPDVLEAVRMLGRANGFDVRTATSPAAVLGLVESEELDVCIIDLNYARDTTSGVEGMDLLA